VNLHYFIIIPGALKEVANAALGGPYFGDAPLYPLEDIIVDGVLQGQQVMTEEPSHYWIGVGLSEITVATDTLTEQAISFILRSVDLDRCGHGDYNEPDEILIEFGLARA